MYLTAMIVTIVLGLSSRKFSDQLPLLISKHAGDMLWASMVYFGFRFIFNNKSLTWAAGISIIFTFAIEFSQLYQADWIIVLRNTIIGSLILGRGFLTVDLIRYVLGITIAFWMDKYWLRHN
jgi:hypothetical protein